MSKTISAVALLQALDEASLSVDDPISDHLPSSWVQGPGVPSITFRHLLTHTSGLDPDPNPPLNVLPDPLSCCDADGQSLQTLRDIIEAGTPGILGFQDAFYTNANFSLLRILIPQITIGEDLIAIYTNVLPEDAVYAGLYEDYVTANVMTPAGIDATTCASDESQISRTLNYNFLMPAAAGDDPGPWTLSCGATGWYASAAELGSFIAHLRFTDDLIDAQTRAAMDAPDGALGWLNPEVFSGWVEGTFGWYRSHGGRFTRMRGCMMNFPASVQATLLINSEDGSGTAPGGSACQALRNAFDDAWTGG